MLHEKKKVTLLLQAQNVVVYDKRKANSRAAYNQTVTSSVLSIVKQGKIPDGRKYEAFINEKRAPGGNWTGVPDLPKVISEHVSLEPLFDIVSRSFHNQDV